MKDWSLIENQISAEIDPAFQDRARRLLQTVYEQKPKIVLDAGCGRGYYLNLLSKFQIIEKIVGIDCCKEHLLFAEELATKNNKIELTFADICNLPFPDNCFDFIICSEVLEHIKNDHHAIKELMRVLKPAGTLAISVPNKNFPLFWDPLNWILMRGFGSHVPKEIHWLAGISPDYARP